VSRETPFHFLMNSSLTRILLPLALGALALAGCSKSSSPEAGSVSSDAPAPATAPTSNAYPGMEADLQRTLKEQSSFYIFKTAADLARDTQGLTWEDGSDLPEFADPAAKKGGTLAYYTPDFPGTFRQFGPDASDPFREYLLDFVALTFVQPHPNYPGRYFPQLASSWAVDSTRRTVFFRLNPDARWSDGVPFSMDDVVFSWYYYRSPLLDDPWSNDFYTKTYSSITVYDAHTFSVTLRELKPDIVDRAGNVNPLPKHFFKDFGPDWVQKYNWRITPTLGAYTIREEDIKRPSSITLSHVNQWWAENKRFARYRFNPDRIRLTVIRDTDKTFESFVRGDVDVLRIGSPQTWYDKLPNDQSSVKSGFTVKSTFYNQIPPPDWALWINEARPFLGDRDVRLGIQFATDFGLVCKQYFRGDAQLEKSTSDGYGWDINPAVGPRPFDPVKAREYFAKAGFTQQGPDGVLINAHGNRLAFTITTIYQRYQDVLLILKQEALKAGLEFNIEVLDQTTGYQKEEEKRHDITLTAFDRTVEMYPRYWESFSGDNAYDVPYLADGSPNPARKVKPNTNNLNSIAIPALDQLIKQYDAAQTMAETKILAAKIEKMIYDDACWVNGWKLPFLWSAYRPWIKWPADFNPMQTRDFEEFWVMWIDQDEQKKDLAAKAEGRALPSQILTYDKYKEP
jgi:microcin C transport system substrate-binding protein